MKIYWMEAQGDEYSLEDIFFSWIVKDSEENSWVVPLTEWKDEREEDWSAGLERERKGNILGERKVWSGHLKAGWNWKGNSEIDRMSRDFSSTFNPLNPWNENEILDCKWLQAPGRSKSNALWNVTLAEASN